MISANAADLEYTECLTTASIFITQVICAFQEVNSELSAKERTEEEVRELQNIPRIMHKVYFSASVSNSKCATSPIVLPLTYC
ncbi:hypothetical protein ANAPC5_00840 [Anaplasma phagocytophilum]|nr:hypothetical protein ANAPC2_00790 [Anaplasma phagocytophilum]SBO32594.1 hypothetical protein ANAPC3_00916 [Anaplasma phagocytophilum]SBO32604.1 hypothetical protein ANAPC4_00867 [Anaplasma phagocytophilum]SCV64359.1 hypothetical protein ANAPC5_00840 [Anaplasma phagocytophilum]